MSKRLGHRLRDERRERKESQRTCAPRFGISQSGYSFWESGINDPDAAQYDAIASFLGITKDDVWSLIHDPDTDAPMGAELAQRVDQVEADAGRLKRELGDVRRELADMARAIDHVTKLLEKKAARRSR